MKTNNDCNECKDSEILLSYIKQLLFDTEHAELDRTKLTPCAEKLADGIEYLGDCIKQEKKMLDDMAEGYLDSDYDCHNDLAASVKSIQSNLKHLTWVAKRVAEGDYKQRVHLMGSFSDAFNEMITQLSNNRDKLEKLINTDALTGVGNRRSFNTTVERLCKENKSFCLSYIDIDGLKSCNNNYGHLEGDNYICSVSNELKSMCDEGEDVFRVGGDEFIFISEKNNAEEMKARFSRAHRAYAKKQRDLVAYPSDFSYGCTDVDGSKIKDSQNMSAMMSLADKRMYDFKIRNYIRRRHLQNFVAADDGKINKSGLDSRIFDALSATGTNRYIFITNLSTNVTRLSMQAVQDFGLPSEYIKDATTLWVSRLHPDDLDKYRRDRELVLSGNRPYFDVDYRIMMPDGTYVRCSCEGYVLKGKTKDEPDLFAGTLTNHGAIDYIDPITNYNNVYAFLRTIQHKKATWDGAAVMIIGINQFSDINNAYGYESGNKILRSFAGLLEGLMGSNRRIYRLDGVKFALILPPDKRNDMQELFERIEELAEKRVYLGSLQIVLSVTGASMIFEHVATDETTILTELMYILGEAKRNHVTTLYEYAEEKSAEVQQKMRKMEAIKRSVRSGCDGFYMVYQPQLDANGKCIGAEGLLRFKNDEYGVIPPNEFIPWLERDSCFYTLGLWILRNGLREGKAFIEECPNFRLSLNVSYRQFENRKFMNDVLNIVGEESFPKENLVLELTEHCQALNHSLLKRYMDEFHNSDVRLAADDFGTGYSSFSLMRTLPFDCIKIDQMFVRHIMEHSEDQVIVESIIHCAKALNQTVCVEGVETQEIFDFVKQFDPGIYQGYLFSRPISPDELMAYMAENMA